MCTPNGDRTASFIDGDIQSFLADLREATMTPSPVSDILADPTLIRTLTRPKTPHRRSSSRNSSKTHKPSNVEPPELPLLSLVLNEEGRQSSQLKMLLRSTTDRLEYEMQRAGAAERRAEYAEKAVRQARERIAQLISAQHQTELTVARLTEEVKRCRMLFENTQAELERAERTIEDLEGRNSRVQNDARQARDVVSKYEKAMMEREAKEQGRQEAIRHMGQRYVDGIVEGRKEGYELAKRMERARRKQIYDAAYRTGFDEGDTQGRAHERRKATDAFDKFQGTTGYTEDGKSVSSKSGD